MWRQCRLLDVLHIFFQPSLWLDNYIFSWGMSSRGMKFNPRQSSRYFIENFPWQLLFCFELKFFKLCDIFFNLLLFHIEINDEFCSVVYTNNIEGGHGGERWWCDGKKIPFGSISSRSTRKTWNESERLKWILLNLMFSDDQQKNIFIWKEFGISKKYKNSILNWMDGRGARGACG